jgi:hypothetical protein
MIDNVVINARALSIITAMADVPRDRLYDKKLSRPLGI